MLRSVINIGLYSPTYKICFELDATQLNKILWHFAGRTVLFYSPCVRFIWILTSIWLPKSLAKPYELKTGSESRWRSTQNCILQFHWLQIVTVPGPRHWIWYENIRQRAAFSSQFASECSKSPNRNQFCIVNLSFRIQYWGGNEADDRDRHVRWIIHHIDRCIDCRGADLPWISKHISQHVKVPRRRPL